MAWKSPAETLQEWRDQRERERLGPSNPFDPPSGLAQGFAQPAASGPASPLSGISISDRVRGGNRYTNMSKRDRDALNLTIAGELAPSSYNTPEGDQEVANMVETITTRAAQKGKSIEDTVQEDRQYSPWNTLPDREKMRERFKAHAPDVRRMVSNAVNGNVMPTHEGLTSYHATTMPGTGRKPPWARGIEPAAEAGKHSFYTNIAPWSSSPRPPGLQLPPDPLIAPDAIASQDLAPLPQPLNAPLGPVTPGADIPPPADYTGPPPYTGGPVNAPLATPPALDAGFTPESGMPAPPEERMGATTPVDPALQQALGPGNPLQAALAEDRATRERALPGTGPTPVPGGTLMPGVDVGQRPSPTPIPVTTTSIAPPAVPPPAQTLQPPGQQLVPEPLEAPAAAAPATPPAPPAPPVPAAPVSTMRDVAMAAHDAGFIGRIYEDPVTHRISGFNHAVDPGLGRGKFPGGEPGGKFPNGQPWTPEQQAQIAAAVPGITTDAGGLRLTPAAPAPQVAPPVAAPEVAPVTPRQEVTPQTPLHPEDSIDQEPADSAPPIIQAPAAVDGPQTPPVPAVPSVPDVAVPAIQAPAVDGPQTGMEQWDPTTRSRNPGFFGRFDRTHFVGGPGLTRPVDPALVTDYTKPTPKQEGEFKPPIGTRTAKRVGGWAGGVGGFVVGGIPGAVAGNRLGTGAGWLLGRLGAFDPNRGPFDSRRKRDKDDEDEDKDPQMLTLNEAKKLESAARTPEGGGTRTGGMFGGGYGNPYKDWGGYAGGDPLGEGVGRGYRNR